MTPPKVDENPPKIDEPTPVAPLENPVEATPAAPQIEEPMKVDNVSPPAVVAAA